MNKPTFKIGEKVANEYYGYYGTVKEIQARHDSYTCKFYYVVEWDRVGFFGRNYKSVERVLEHSLNKIYE